MDIQQILTAGTGTPAASNGSGSGAAGALTGDGFAKALASLSPQAGAQPAPGSGAESSPPASRLPTAAADGEALPERLQRLLASAAEGEDVSKDLAALLSSVDGEDAAGQLRQALASLAEGDGLPEALQTLLGAIAEGEDPSAVLQRMKAAADTSDEATSPELVAALQTLVAPQPSGQRDATAPAQASADRARSALPGLASGAATPSTNPLLEAARGRADGISNAVNGTTTNATTSAALAAAEAVRQAAAGASPGGSAQASPQTMLEALAARRQGQSASGQEALPAAGGAFAGHLSSLTTATANAAGVATAQQTSLSAPVGSQTWPGQLGQRLVQFARQGGEQHIEMKLHPAELGPLSVTLKVGDQGAQAHFLSSHAQVRHALEQAIPQLREALAGQGIALGETSVGEQRQGGSEGEGRRFAETAGGPSGSEGEEPSELARATPPLERVLDGRVDLYA
ncbi:flagellar hook-length control protein FliK [Halomonas getboli]|uniref:flagellar hook-length control protein FliK n=1 Tax=Halomonas getboli TaxID=2935862 RepID=UPI00200053F3|nr:flagellar hook-length control protein FliK [Halomonas getboli]MCK2184926.1 flagellar hook-length control protein FliK [Halomonas getboli]